MSRFRYGKDHLSEKHYATFFEDLEQRSWQDSMDRLLSRKDIVKPAKILRFLNDRRRNDFIFLLPICRDSIVLDFGSGWGNTSYTLAGYCRHVVAMEADANRLRFSAEHFAHNGCENVFPVSSYAAPHLPFADEVFDAVIMNGVLEWTATAAPGNPGDVHRRILGEIRRVLKPGGHVLIAIENRYSYKFLMGMRDHHAGGLRWVTMLPRWLANVYSFLRLGRSYRTWFYGYEALRNLVTEAGFTIPDFYSYHPNHVAYTHLFRIDNDENAQRYMHELYTTWPLKRRDRFVYRLCDGLVPFSKLAHDYMFIAHKLGNRPVAPLSEIVLRAAKAKQPDDVALNLRSTARNVLLEATVKGKPRALVKLPRDDASIDNIRRETECLRRLGALGLPGNEVEVPKLIETGITLGKPYLAMSHVSGLPKLDSTGSESPRRAITKWLIELGRATAVGGVDSDFISGWATAAERAVPELSAMATKLSSVDADRATSLPRVLVHGDLSPNNILTDGERLSVIDWEFGRVEGFPLTDLIDFLLYGLFSRSGDYRQAWKALFQEPSGAALRESLRDYCNALGIDHAHVGFLALMFVLGKLTLLGPMSAPKAVLKRSQLLDTLENMEFGSLCL